MIMKKLIRTLLCCLLFLLSTGMYAQKGLQIASVFQKYGNEKRGHLCGIIEDVIQNMGHNPLPKPKAVES